MCRPISPFWRRVGKCYQPARALELPHSNQSALKDNTQHCSLLIFNTVFITIGSKQEARWSSKSHMSAQCEHGQLWGSSSSGVDDYTSRFKALGLPLHPHTQVNKASRPCSTGAGVEETQDTHFHSLVNRNVRCQQPRVEMGRDPHTQEGRGSPKHLHRSSCLPPPHFSAQGLCGTLRTASGPKHFPFRLNQLSGHILLNPHAH